MRPIHPILNSSCEAPSRYNHTAADGRLDGGRGLDGWAGVPAGFAGTVQSLVRGET